jgi:hypothetical protein
MKISSERGIAHILLLVSAVGIISFLVIASLGTFNRGPLADLFAKKLSFASLSGPINPPPVSGPINPTPTPMPSTASPSATPTTGSVIKIYATGTPANGVYPTMQLILNGRVAKTFTNVNGDPAVRPFTEYSYTIPVPVKITPDLVRISYTNDLRVGVGNDRNLFVDKINIDGVDYQSERSTTYSTGSWNFSQKSCIPGRYQTEALVCNGYFEYR